MSSHSQVQQIRVFVIEAKAFMAPNHLPTQEH